MKKLLFYSIAILCFSLTATAQNNNLGIGTGTPDASAMLEILSNNKGLLVPRMTATERLAIPAPANSLIVYDTDSACLFFYKQPATEWINLCKPTVAPNTDEQTLTISGDTLYIANGNYVLLTNYLDNTDSQTLFMNGDSLLIENGNGVSLSNYINTDEQTLSFFNDSLAISNGDTVDLSSLANVPETDPLFGASLAAGIIATDTSNWNSAYNWGNHALEGYLKSTDTLDLIADMDRNTKISIDNFNNIHIYQNGTEYFQMNAGRIYFFNTGANTYIGENAGQNANLSSGTGNTALGFSALKSTSGIARDNTAIGSQSMESSTSGSENVAIGRQSLQGGNPGNGNVAIGMRALGQNSGQKNVGIGRDVMRFNSGGSFNTSVGQESGNQNQGSFNVFLGYQAGYNETGSNKLYIDNSNTSTPLIYGDFTNNKLRINGELSISNLVYDSTNDSILVATGDGTIAYRSAATIGGNSTVLPSGTSPGEMLYWNGTDWDTLAAGSYGQVLTFCNGIPTWGGCPLLITTNTVSSIGYNSAISGGNVTNDGGTAITSRGVCFSTNPNPTTSDSITTDGTGLGNYQSSLTGLAPGITYFIRAYAVNSAGTAYGNEIIFSTLDTLATLTTDSLSGIGQNVAITGGNISSDGGSAVTSRGVCYSVNPNPTIADNITTDGTGSGIFSSNLAGLTPATSYYVRAYATNSVGTSYGNEINFFTSDSLATLTTTTVSGITKTTAVSGGSISTYGVTNIISRGVCWSTSPNPTIADDTTQNGNGTGVFVSNMPGLIAGAAYYVRAYAISSAGTSYGNEFSFTTINLLVQERLDTLETPISIFNSGIPLDSLYGKIYQGGVIAYLNTSTGGGFVAAPADLGTAPWGCSGTTIGTSESLGAGAQNTINIENACSTPNTAADKCANIVTGTTTIFSDWFLPSANELLRLYNNIGPGAPAPNTNVGNFISNAYWSSSEFPLDPANYGLAKFFNASGNGFYDGKNFSYSVRAIRSFGGFTSLEQPVLTTSAVSSISTSTATSGGNISSDGGTPVISRGVCWSTSPNPTITNSKTIDGSGTGSFTSNISSLGSAVTYYVRAYATNSVGTAYGNEIIFITGFDVQARLDTLETPKQIFDSGLPLDSLYGKNYQGGFIAYLNTTSGAGFVAAPTDQGTAPWGCSGITIGTAESVGAGAQNTINIENTCTTPNTAADLCANLVTGTSTVYSDWFLPSALELKKMYDNIGPGASAPNTNVGNFISNAYWSSSEFPLDAANDGLAKLFYSSGNGFYDGKSFSYSVRAIRSFGGFTSLEQPILSTTTLANVTRSDAISGGIISSDGGNAIIAKGVCWSTSPNPTIYNDTTNNGSGTGSFTSIIAGYNPGSTYYVRAYATNSVGTAYGNEFSFATAVVMQGRLDNGETPQQLYNTGVPLDSIFGLRYQGGLIFYLNTSNGTGFVAAPYDQTTGNSVQYWGCVTLKILDDDIGDGYQNTIDIVNDLSLCTYPPSEPIPARICQDLVLGGFSDWFLPSRDELEILNNNLFAKGYGGPINPVGYWSSSYAGCHPDLIWVLDFNSPWGDTRIRGNLFRNYYTGQCGVGYGWHPCTCGYVWEQYQVRAVRAF